MTRRARAQGDDGVVLPIALAFVMVIGLVIGALLSQSATQFRATAAFRDRQQGIFAADSGLERALAGIDMISDSTNPDEIPVQSTHEEAVGSQTIILFGTPQVRLNDFTVTAGPGGNRLVIVAVGNDDNHPPAQVLFGSHPMHAIGQRADIGGNNTTLWYLLLDGEFAPGLAAGNYDITARFTPIVAFTTVTYTIHASSWTGVLQQVEGTPFGPTDYARNQINTNVPSISSVVSTDTADALVFSAGGRDGGGSMIDSAGMTRLTSGPSASGSIFGTSYAVVPEATVEFTATQAWSTSDSPATQAVAVFRPASWVPLRFGGICEDPGSLGTTPYNGYNVTVVCDLNDAGDALTVTSTATAVDDGRVITAHATVTRLPSGTIEITEWDTRPAAPPGP